MADPVSYKLKLPPVAGIVSEIAEAVDQIVRTSAFSLEGLAKRNIVEMNAVDTGFLVNSVYTRTSEGSGYQAAKSAATERAPRRMDSTRATGTRRPGRAEVIIGAEYAVYVHDGARGRSARPFLAQAIAEEAPQFERDLRGLFRPKGAP